MIRKRRLALGLSQEALVHGAGTQEQRDLVDFISAISGRNYCAGRMQGIEREVWKAMHTPGFGGAPKKFSSSMP